MQFAEYHVTQMNLRLGFERAALEQFLQKHHLKLEQDVTVAFGVFDGEETLCGCGCAAGSLLKCFAVDDALRGQNALGMLVTQLMQERFAAGVYDLFVITRLANKALFAHCGFFPLAETEELVMLENRQDGIRRFTEPLREPGEEAKTVGAIVMNCNPFTKGHRALVEYAAAACDVLHLFVVEENRSAFPASVRLALVQEGTRDLPGVRVHLSGPYMISAATFPTYFLKQNEDGTALQTRLDIALFAERIAPALHITRRFAGQEPFDPVTEQYNRAMRELLPAHGIEFVEIPRIKAGDEVVSASRVRRLLRESGVTEEVLQLVPEATADYLKREWTQQNQAEKSGKSER